MSPTGPSTDRLFHADKLYCTQLFTKKELIKYLEKQSNFFFFFFWPGKHYSLKFLSMEFHIHVL